MASTRESKKKTDWLLMAAHSQSVRTKVLKAKIDRLQNDSLCRMCLQKDEIVSQLLFECPKLARKLKEYKQRHGGVAGLCIGICANNMEWRDKWYKHIPKDAEDIENFKLLWDFYLQTDRMKCRTSYSQYERNMRGLPTGS